MAKAITVEFTPAQIRAVNSALALLECEVEDGIGPHQTRLHVIRDTRAKVHEALDRAGARR